MFPESLKGPSGLSSGPRGPGRPSAPLRGPRGPSLSPSGPFNASENTVHTALIFLHARAPPCKLEKYHSGTQRFLFKIAIDLSNTFYLGIKLADCG